MGVPVDITKLRKWEVFAEAPSWPGAPDALFIVAAATRVLAAKFGMLPHDIAADPDSSGYRNEIANSLGALLTSGSLLATARRVDGSRQEAVAPTEWTPLTAHNAVATGIVHRDHGRKRDVPHWVFVGRRETEILTALYRATDMLYPSEEAGPTEALGETVLAAVSALACNPAAIAADDLASATLRLLQPHMIRTLHPQQRDTLVTASVPWLLERFSDPGTARWDYGDFAKAAMEQLAPAMTGRLFEKAWDRTRDRVRNAERHLGELAAWKTEPEGVAKDETKVEAVARQQAEKLVVHVGRFTSGPNAKPR